MLIHKIPPVDFYWLRADLKTAFGSSAHNENYKRRRRETTTGTTKRNHKYIKLCLGIVNVIFSVSLCRGYIYIYAYAIDLMVYFLGIL